MGQLNLPPKKPFFGKDDSDDTPMAFVVEVHNYESDPQSGAGNCKRCQNPEHHRRHPHPYKEARDFRRVCVCGGTTHALIHKVGSI